MNDRTLVVSPDRFDGATLPVAPRRRSPWRWLKWLLWVLLGVILLLALAIGGVLWWASTAQSLPRALQLAERYLPEGQTLHVEGASGSITGGGQIRALQWSMPGTALEIDNLTLDWSLSELWGRALHVRTLQAERIHVLLTPQPDRPEPASEPFQMPDSVTLPIAITLPVQVGRLEIETQAEDGSRSLQALDDIQARYQYDHTWHDLQLSSLRYGDSSVQGEVRLHAQELDVQARIGAWLSHLVPDVPATLQALLQADGTLAGGDAAQLRIALDAHQQPAAAAAPEAGANLLERVASALRLEQGTAPVGTAEPTGEAPPATDPDGLAELALQAVVHPWRSQPVQQADVQLAHLNAQALHSAAPATALSGTIRVAPDGAADATAQAALATAAWAINADVQNAQPGAWNAGRLPLRSVVADVHYAPERITIEAAELQLEGDGPAGSIRLEGQADPAQLHQAELQLVLDALNLQPLMAGLPVSALSGGATVQPLHPDAVLPAGATLADAEWKLVVDIQNQQPGVLDQERLPLRSITAQVDYAPQRVLIQQAEIALEGTAPAGRITLAGQANPQQPADAQAALTLHALNLQALMETLPATLLSGDATVRPLDAAAPPPEDIAQAHWQIEADIRNAQPGLIDQQRLPLSQLLASAQLTPERWTAQTLQAHVGDGRIQLQGHYEPATQALDISGEVQQLPLVQIHGELAAEQVPDLSGTLTASGQLDTGVVFDVDITSQGVTTAASGNQRSQWDVRAIQAKGRWTPELLDVERIHLDAFQAKVDSTGVRVALPAADDIQATITATAPGLSLNADAAMQQAQGGGQLALTIASAEQLLNWAQALPVVGQALPALQASGAAAIQADWQGGWQQWLEGLQNPAAHPNLRLNLLAQSKGLQVVLPAGEGAAGDGTAIDVRALDVAVQGNLAAANLTAQADLTANGTQAVFDARAAMAQRSAGGAPQWDVTVEQLTAAATLPEQAAPWRLELGPGLQVTAQTGNTLVVTTTAGQATLTPPQGVAQAGEQLALRWEPLRFAQTAAGATSLQTRGQLEGLVLAWVDGLVPDNPPLKAAGIQSSLVVSGDWDIDMGEALQLRANLRRDRGDLWLGEPEVQAVQGAVNEDTTIQATPATTRSRGVAAGIRTLEVGVQSRGEAVEATVVWDTERAGVINAQAQTRLARQDGGWTLPDGAPLSGRVQAQLQDLGVYGGLAPLGWRITGALDADVALAGTVQAPQLQGQIQASGLNLRSVLDGVDLHDGRLRATLHGNRLDIEELMFQGGTGSNAYVRGLSGNRTQAPTERGQMVASGTIDWSGVASATGQQTGIALDVNARLESMQVLVRNDRQVSVSGELAAGLVGGALRVRGDINVDRASITLPESGAPTLGSDVVVVRRSEQKEAQDDAPLPRGELQTAQPMDMAVNLNLGRDFALQGYGITSRLEGELTIRSTTSGNDPISIVGEIRTDEGRYRAWGQALNVETGIVRFNGPYTNPSLNLLAIRPNIDVRAGVRVTGTALAPRVQLYSEPSLPEAETLSWVVLGRSPGTGGGDGNAMQQAALGLLAGSVGNSLAEGLGFDEVGLSESGVSIGKRLSDQLYVTYEAGMSGAASTLYVFYDITRRLTARGQTGEASAVDLIYTISYD